MKRIGKRLQAERADLVKRLTERGDAIDAALVELNNTIDAYNELVQTASAFRDAIVSEMETYFEARFEAWQNSDDGENYRTWIEEWEGFDFEPIDAFELPDLSHADALEALSEECPS